MTEKRNNPRNIILAMDILHLAVGAAIVILAVIAFISPDDHMIFFPVIFFLASLLNLVNGIQSIRTAGRDRKRKTAGMGIFLFGVILLVIGIASSVFIFG